MEKLGVAWSYADEVENIARFSINFKEAKEVVLNMSSLKMRNIERDYMFIGPVADLSQILVVNCVQEEGFRKIVWARRGSQEEKNAYFDFLAEGDLK